MKIIDKKHPDYPKYIEKCKALAKRTDEEIAKIESKPLCHDGPSTAIYKKEARELKKLQEEYAYLFVEKSE